MLKLNQRMRSARKSTMALIGNNHSFELEREGYENKIGFRKSGVNGSLLNLLAL